MNGPVNNDFFNVYRKELLWGIGLVTLIMLLLIIFMGFKSHSEIDETISQQYNEQQLLLARQISTGIEEFLLEKVTLLESLAENEPDVSNEKYKQLFRDLYYGSSGYYVIEFINESGIVVTGYPEENTPVGYDLYANNREWAIEHVKETRTSYCTNPMELLEGGFASFIWVPVYNGTEYKGAILSIIEIETLSEKYLKTINSSEHIYVVDRQGQIIFDSSGKYQRGWNYFDILNSSNSTWIPILQDQVNGSEGMASYIDYDESGTMEERLIAYSPIEWRRRLWSVAVSSPVSDVEDIMHETFLDQILFTGFACTTTVLGGFSIVYLLVWWNRSLEVEVKRKTGELELSNKYLEEANTRLEELDQIKSDYMAMASHELRTPLTNIKTAAELLRDVGEDGLVDNSEILDKIILNVERQSRMVTDLLDLTRIESGIIKYDIDQVDLHKVIETSIEAVEKEAYDLGISINTSIPDGLPAIAGNNDSLVSVFVNLLNNSLKFTPWGGRIDISVEELDDRIQVTVKDNGIGIESTDMERLFEKFYKAGNELYDERVGSGIGLAIVKGIIDGHGGTIRAESKKGEGVSFIFTLNK